MPVGRKSTRLKIAFFGLLLTGFIGIQYSWLSSLQKDKLQQFKTRMMSGISVAADKLPLAESLHDLADTAITNIFRRSFSSKGLKNLRFEYAITANEKNIASAGFNKRQNDTVNSLILHYELRHTGESRRRSEIMTVVVPSWKKSALKEMGWVIIGSVLLSLMILAIFCSTSFIGAKRQQVLYDDRTVVIKNMMQQLEAPLSTVSVAADALRNARVKHRSEEHTSELQSPI